MKLTIIQADNGYVVTNHQEYDDDVKDEIHVFEDDDERTGLKNMLEYVAESTGYFYDKFKRNNLSITFDRVGHKVEDEEPEYKLPGHEETMIDLDKLTVSIG